MNHQLLVKASQSVFNRKGIADSYNTASEIVAKVMSNLTSFKLQYGIEDEFDLIEAVTLSILKTAGK